MVRNPPKGWQRWLILGLMAWGLLTIVPDLWRPFGHFGTLGFEANNDGHVDDVSGNVDASPTGCINNGDWIAMTPSIVPSKDLLLVFGGMGGLQYVKLGQTAHLQIAGTRGGPSHSCTIKSMSLPKGQGSLLHDLDAWQFWPPILVEDLLGILFILVCGRIAWQHSSPATWGFLLYGIWFNPGQFFGLYAHLMPYPPLILLQETAQSLFQALGYCGFIVFALHFPNLPMTPRWRPLYRALPVVGVVLALLQLAGFATAFGFRTEAVSDWFYYAGAIVDISVWVILYVRFREMAPIDRQRTRWVLWGSAVGLSAFILADISESTSILNNVWSPTEPELAYLYMLNFVVVVAVYEAVRRYRVFDVRFMVTRYSVYTTAVTLAIGTLLLSEQFLHDLLHEAISQYLVLIILGIGLALAVESLREVLDRNLSRYFFPRIHKTQEHLEQIKAKFREARDAASVDRLLVSVPTEWLGIASAAAFRRSDTNALHSMVASIGWNERGEPDIPAGANLLSNLKEKDRPIRIDERESLPVPAPTDVGHPVLAVPVMDVRDHLTAVVFYGAHVEGDDVLKEEMVIADELGREAARAYGRIQIQELETKLEELEANESGGYAVAAEAAESAKFGGN